MAERRAIRPSAPRAAIAIAGAVLVGVGAVLAAASTGGSTVLDPGAVERDVAAQFQQREGVAVVLTCPADMKVRARATYECTGTTDMGEEVVVQLTVTDEDRAAYTWSEP